jgi:hypothetical protein
MKKIYTVLLLIVIFYSEVKSQTLECGVCPSFALIENEICQSGTNNICENSISINCNQPVCGTTYNESLTGFDQDFYKINVTQSGNVNFKFIGQRPMLVAIIDNCVDQNVIAFMTTLSCQEDSIFTNLVQGTYYISISLVDVVTETPCSNNIQYNFIFKCGTPAPCNLSVSTDYTAPCPGSSDLGSALIFTDGTSGGFLDVQWSDGGFDLDRFDLNPGTYSYTVTDISTGCLASDTFSITPVCSSPISLSAVNITTNKATVTWVASGPCEVKYRLQYRQQGTTNWTSLFISQFSKQLTSLLSGTTYEYRLRSVCTADGSSLSSWTGINTFTTLTPNQGVCAKPTGLNTNLISINSSTVNWTGVSGIYKYRLRYRAQGTTTWTTLVIPATAISKNITGLIPSTTYEYQLRSQCDNTGTAFSNYTTLNTFTTLSLRLEEQNNTIIKLFPNPTNDIINLEINSNSDCDLSFTIFDVLGKEVLSNQLNIRSGNSTSKLNLNQLPSGIYFIRLYGNNINIIERLVKN